MVDGRAGRDDHSYGMRQDVSYCVLLSFDVPDIRRIFYVCQLPRHPRSEVIRGVAHDIRERLVARQDMELPGLQEMLKVTHRFIYCHELPVKRAVILLPGVQAFAAEGNWSDDAVYILLQYFTCFG